MLNAILFMILGTLGVQQTVQSITCSAHEARILEQFQESAYDVDISEACDLDPKACAVYIEQCGKP